MTIAVKAGKVYGLRKMSNIDNIKNYTVIEDVYKRQYL